MISLSEIITRETVTLGPEDPVSRAGELMKEHRIRHIPIVKKSQELVGLISQRDILAVASADSECKVAADLMRTSVHTVSEDADMRGAALTMQKFKIGSLPVVNNGKLVGIVTDSDYVSLAINLLEQIELMESEESGDYGYLEDIDELSDLAIDE